MEKLIPLSKIKVGDRFRKDLGDIVDTARKLLTTKGLKFNYIVVELIDDEYHLRAGERRYRAYELLSSGNKEAWGEITPTEEEKFLFSEIPSTVVSDLTPKQRLRIEMLENLNRKDMNWSEMANLVKSFHDICQEEYGTAKKGPGKTGWGTRDTGKEIGMNPADVVHYIKLAEGLILSPEIQNIQQKSKALTKLKRLGLVQMSNLLDAEPYSDESVKIVIGDSREKMLELEDESIDLLLTDPPWGIEVEDSMHQERDIVYTQYDKDYDIMTTLEILTLCYNKMKLNSPIYMFYSSLPKKVLEGQNLLKGAGFSIELIPLIWYKKHILTHDNRDARHALSYECILYGWKGERPLFTQPSRNVFEHQVPFHNRIHSAEKAESLLAEIVSLHTKENDLVVDPFGGSCKIADVCRKLIRKCIVIEIDEELTKMATMRLRGLL